VGLIVNGETIVSQNEVPTLAEAKDIGRQFFLTEATRRAEVKAGVGPTVAVISVAAESKYRTAVEERKVKDAEAAILAAEKAEQQRKDAAALVIKLEIEAKDRIAKADQQRKAAEEQERQKTAEQKEREAADAASAAEKAEQKRIDDEADAARLEFDAKDRITKAKASRDRTAAEAQAERDRTVAEAEALRVKYQPLYMPACRQKIIELNEQLTALVAANEVIANALSTLAAGERGQKLLEQDANLKAVADTAALAAPKPKKTRKKAAPKSTPTPNETSK
jgi:hypothetical protein